MIKTQGGNSVHVIYVLAKVERKSTHSKISQTLLNIN